MEGGDGGDGAETMTPATAWRRREDGVETTRAARRLRSMRSSGGGRRMARRFAVREYIGTPL
jgi:hypothetical protein